MLQTSQDVLFLTVSVCTVAFTVFLCAVLYYLAHLLKQSNQVVSELRIKIDEWTDAIDEVKNRVMNTTAMLSTIGSQIGRVLDFLGRKKSSREEIELEEEESEVVRHKRHKKKR